MLVITIEEGSRRGMLLRLLLLLVVFAAVLTAPTAPASPPASSGRLAGVTTIRWSGAAAIRLHVPEDVVIPAAARRLTVARGARYALVRMTPDPQPWCDKQTICAMDSLTWFADIAETVGHESPSSSPPDDHYSTLGDPPRVPKGSWLLYLFTDTTATLELRVPGLTGRTGYVAGGRVTGGVRRIPVMCGDNPACDPATGVADSASFGGVTIAIPGLGYAETMAYGAIGSRGQPSRNQLLAVRACRYPNRFEPSASTAAADHPMGCDAAAPAGVPPAENANAIIAEAAGVSVGIGSFQLRGEFDSQGDVYAGFRVMAVGPEPSRRAGWALWFRYGIHEHLG